MAPLQKNPTGGRIGDPQAGRRIAWEKVGFWLALAGVPTCGLTLLPAVVVSVLGLTGREGRRHAWAGLILSMTLISAYVYLVLPMIPTGTRAHAINRVKFRLAWPQHAFWLKWDRGRLERTKTLKLPLFVRYGVLFFEGPAGSYRLERVVEFARKNGWECQGRTRFTAAQFRTHEIAEIDASQPAAWWGVVAYFCYSGKHSWQMKDATVLAFDTGNGHGVPSFVSIAEDGSAVEVRFQDPILPDGPSEFRLPDGYEPPDNEPNRGG